VTSSNWGWTFICIDSSSCSTS